ncbi:type IX secretion system sortase PorU [Edaphocola flava]|uniref:type IX secretion system sortase PorU n=1 Tax=Edaphocola flava TaxID=2499629 RepID=UPI00100A66AE|nr:type IX secretion system sortase PorU [Edaphocola flava]
MKIPQLLVAVSLICSSAAMAGVKRTIPVQQFKSYEINDQGIYVNRFPLNNAYDTPVIEIKNIQAVALQMDVPSGIEIANGKPVPRIFFGKERKQAMATINMPMFYRENQVIYKITGFDVVIDEETAPQVLGRTYAGHSVLATGNWYKIAASQRGVFKIDYAFLQSLGINPATVNPNNIRLYGNGGTVIPEAVTDGAPDDLVENAIEVHSSGSTFGPNDYVLFYANGPQSWQFSVVDQQFVHTQNYYENKSYYFLNVDLGPGKRIQALGAPGAPVVETFNTFNDYRVYEKDSVNIAQMGKEWYSNMMNSNNSSSLNQYVSINLGSVSDTVRYTFRAAGKVDVGSGMVSLFNGSTALTSINFLPSGSASVAFSTDSRSGVFTTNQPSLNFRVNFSSSQSNRAYLDYIRVNYKRPLSLQNGQMNFRAIAQRYISDAVAYNLGNMNSASRVWDVSDMLAPKTVSGSLSGSTFSFSDNGGALKEYIAFDGSTYLAPEKIGTVENQDLHAMAQVDYLIITNNTLKPAAEELAQMHRTKYNTRVEVVTIDKIYNEFSSGGQDIAGLRNFIRMFYDRGTGSDLIKNVLLFGMASFDYKDRISNNTNLVPTYQTLNSQNKTLAFATDEYYTLLDDGEDVNSNGNQGDYIDIGLGRIPAATLAEAQAVVQKIKRYTSSQAFGEWKNNLTLVTDDYEPGFYFLTSSESISDAIAGADFGMNQSKLYTDAAPRIATPSGTKFPTVTRDINNQIINGTFLMNYIGHGSPQRWALEEILYKGDIEQWNNDSKLPIMVTGTCDYGRFDNPEEPSSGAYLITKSNGGAIAAITTTQEVYEGQNNRMNIGYLSAQFEKDANGRYLTFGEAFREGKNRAGASVQDNSRKFALLGDPAIKPALPENVVQTDSILVKTNTGTFVPADSLNALGKYKIYGNIADANGNVKTGFNGQVFITVFDKMKIVTATNPALLASAQQKTYKSQNNILFKGSAQVVNGVFTIDAIIPKDINYDFGKCKISYYAYSTDEDAAGTDTSFVLGGFSAFADADNQGPVVRPYIDNNKFRDGDIVSANPLLYVELEDDNGINVSGSSVGHDLIAVLDGDYESPFILNALYTPELNDYTRGKVYFQLNKIPVGKHTITVRAWDVYNNSGEGTVNFEVRGSDTVAFDVYNYPNPFSDQTNIVIQHNQPNTDMELSLRIFNSAGMEIYTKTQQIRPTGSFTTWQWDGSTSAGSKLANGIYFYQVHMKTAKGAESAHQKLILTRQ